MSGLLINEIVKLLDPYTKYELIRRTDKIENIQLRIIDEIRFLADENGIVLDEPSRVKIATELANYNPKYKLKNGIHDDFDTTILYTCNNIGKESSSSVGTRQIFGISATLFDQYKKPALVIVSPDKSEPRPLASGFPIPNGRGSVVPDKTTTDTKKPQQNILSLTKDIVLAMLKGDYTASSRVEETDDRKEYQIAVIEQIKNNAKNIGIGGKKGLEVLTQNEIALDSIAEQIVNLSFTKGNVQSISKQIASHASYLFNQLKFSGKVPGSFTTALTPEGGSSDTGTPGKTGSGIPLPRFPKDEIQFLVAMRHHFPLKASTTQWTHSAVKSSIHGGGYTIQSSYDGKHQKELDCEVDNAGKVSASLPKQFTDEGQRNHLVNTLIAAYFAAGNNPKTEQEVIITCYDPQLRSALANGIKIHINHLKTLSQPAPAVTSSGKVLNSESTEGFEGSEYSHQTRAYS